MVLSDSKVLIYFNNAIGDAFMTIPTIRALSRNSGSVSLVCREPYFFLFQELEFEHAYFFDPSDEEFSSLDEISNVTFDYFISLSSHHDDPIEYILNRNTFVQTIGYCGDSYDVTIIDEYGQTNMFDVYFRSFQNFSPDACIEDYSEPIEPIDPKLTSVIESFEYPIISIHTDTKEDKQWPMDKFERLIDRILSDFEDVLIAIVGLASTDFTPISERVLQIPDANFQYSWELVCNSVFFIGIDSCFMHLADVNRIPAISLYGKTLTEEWGHRFSANSTIIRGRNSDVKLIEEDEVFSVFSQRFTEIYSLD